VWPFSKKPRDLQLLSVDEHEWTVGEATHDGSPLIVRFNQTAKRWDRHPELSIKLGFAISLNQPNAGGMPSADENAELGDIEELIEKEVKSATVGIHVLTLTTGLMKELVFYIAPGQDIGKLHGTIREKVPSHEVQCMAAPEPSWDSFRAFSR